MNTHKLIFLPIICAFICSLCACAESSTTAEAPSVEKTAEIVGTDYTVTPEIIYDLESMKVGQSSDSRPEFAYDPSIETQTSLAEVIVRGEIVNIYYTSHDSSPFTQMDVRITEPIAGGYAQGDIISVYTYGGYISYADRFSQSEIDDFFSNMTEEQLENTLLLHTIEGAPLPEVGEEYVFFADESTVFADSYEAVLTYSNSMFAPEGDSFINEINGESFSLSELETAVLETAGNDAVTE